MSFSCAFNHIVHSLSKELQLALPNSLLIDQCIRLCQICIYTVLIFFLISKEKYIKMKEETPN